MGYLNNSTITVDAILTKKGREYLSKNQPFNITHFALGDDEIDYGLFNENHPNGSQYSGEAIENMNLIEAIPNEQHIMKSKLITLTPPVTIVPHIIVTQPDPAFLGTTTQITPVTSGLNGTVNGASAAESGYIFTITDGRLVNNFGAAVPAGTSTITDLALTPFSLTYQGTTLSLTAVGDSQLFGSFPGLITTINITGVDTGATSTITYTVVKDQTNTTGTGAVPSNY